MEQLLHILMLFWSLLVTMFDALRDLIFAFKLVT